MSLTPAQQRRFDAVHGLFEGLPAMITEWEDIHFDTVLERMAAAVSLGRTARWQNACRFAQAEVDTDPGIERTRWAVLQGSIWMSHAID